MGKPLRNGYALRAAPNAPRVADRSATSAPRDAGMAPMTPRAASQTIVDLRSKLAEAEASLPALEKGFQEAALADLSGDDAGAAEAALAAVQEAQAQIAKLRAAIPAAERQEAQAIAAAQAKIRAQHLTKLTKDLKELETQA